MWAGGVNSLLAIAVATFLPLHMSYPSKSKLKSQQQVPCRGDSSMYQELIWGDQQQVPCRGGVGTLGWLNTEGAETNLSKAVKQQLEKVAEKIWVD